MKRLLLIVPAAAFMAGCGDSEKVPAPAAPLPQSAALRDSQEKAGMSAREQAGQKMNQDMAAAAAAMKAARSKQGGG
jgi:nitrous oxide reductase accessory protein NosL